MAQDRARPTEPEIGARTVSVDDFHYLGAFRLPLDEDEDNSFAWGAHALTYRCGGDPKGPDDGFPGSLFITGHPYQLPSGRQIAEIAIPAPGASRKLNDLPTATILQQLQNVTGTSFARNSELPRVGLEYLDTPATGPKVHIAFGQHMGTDIAEGTHGVFDPDLERPNFQGPWRLAGHSTFSVNDYLFEIPRDWADRFAEGRVLATGRFRDGGWSGMGPSLIAYRSWDDEGVFPGPGTELASTTLLNYQSSEEGFDPARILEGYQHPDSWEGGAWLTTTTGKAAVLFAGTKGVGERFWYGFANLEGPQFPCVFAGSSGEEWSCSMASGQPCPREDYQECKAHNGVRGWWSNRFEAQFILYDPNDLAKVATGALEPFEPQPYARLVVDDNLLLNAGDLPELGLGDQRLQRIGAIAYDRVGDHLYVLEPHADSNKPVIHVWQVR
ncbi:MAG: hypothetical protein C0606_06030 [Hyphomicrobiales bacterium]|nr:MAG: hypothetical protein C0606_06030 [Hyphomicrobiales bacterium]